MTRLLTGTAAGLLLGLTPALAQTGMPLDDTQTPPAMEQTSPSDAVPMEPSEPGTAIPGQSSEMTPDSAIISDMPEVTTTLDEPITPEEAKDAMEESASLDSPIFASKQSSDQWLASNLIGQPVLNGADESIGEINDIVTNEDGEAVAVLIGVGGFLGIGEKNVAVRYQELTFARGEDQAVKVTTNLSGAILTSAPDYERLSEQTLTVGENTTDIEKDPGIY